MSDDFLPGFPRDEQEKPPTRTELKRQEKMDLALEVWRRRGNEAAVAKALGLPTTRAGKRAANIWVNRAIKELGEERAEEREKVYQLINEKLKMALTAVADAVEEGDLSRIESLVRVADRLAKLHGTDAQREVEGSGIQAIVIRGGIGDGAWERTADVESTAEDSESGDAGIPATP